MANCCTTFMKLIFLSIATLLGLTGVLLTYIGTHKTLNVPLADVDNKTRANLADFLDCQDIAEERYNAHKKNMAGNEDIIKGMLVAQCMEPVQLPAGVIFNTAATMSMFSLISGIVAGCRDVKGNLYSYTIISATSISLSIVSIAWMAMISSKAMRNFAPCNMFSSETADALEKDFNFQCVTFKDSIEPDVGVALRWMSGVAIFYAGCILSVLSLLMFMVMNSCASSNNLQRVEKKDANYNRMDSNGQPTNRY